MRDSISSQIISRPVKSLITILLVLEASPESTASISNEKYIETSPTLFFTVSTILAVQSHQLDLRDLHEALHLIVHDVLPLESVCGVTRGPF